jgi:hypothetical protein
MFYLLLKKSNPVRCVDNTPERYDHPHGQKHCGYNSAGAKEDELILYKPAEIIIAHI